MLDQIRDVIAKNLPMEVGNQLKQHLDEAQKWKAELDSTRETCAKLRRDLDEVRANRDQFQAQLSQHAELAVREKAVTGRELKLDLTLAQERQKMADERLAEIRMLVGQVFRNPELVTRTNGTIPHPTQGSMYRSDEERKTVE
jgi:chromosome segregation ATPase